MNKPTLAFALSVFLGAFLLFQLQPLVGKTILPWFGGSPSVWSTCMLVFQVLLFAGYSYAFASVTFLTPRRQFIVHIVLSLAALITLPIVPAETWKPTGVENPVVRIVIVLLSSIGLPFVVLSSTGPLLQAWFHRIAPNRSPYRLYSLSNLGSLLALLSFPYLLEPRMSVGTMATLWGIGFLIYTLTSSMAGWDAAKVDAPSDKELTQDPSSKILQDETAPEQPMQSGLALWFLLAAIPSALLLATTNHICQDIASVPFLWIMPLAIYLITFIIAFDSPRWYFPNMYSGLTLVSGVGVAYLLGLETYVPVQFQVSVFLAALFVCSMFCHGELARSKPSPKFLTLFYLVISGGGALGGILVTLVAPIVLTDFYELHLGMAVVCCIVPAILWYRLGRTEQGQKRIVASTISGVVAIGVVAIGVVGMLVYQIFGTANEAVDQSRSFYGVTRVVDEGADGEQPSVRLLFSGRIRHGAQFLAPEKKNLATYYYAPTTGIGQIMQHHHADRARRMGFVGLGAGTLATYGKADDTMIFYEINDAVARVAKEEFSFLTDCQADWEVRLGDGRLLLERELARGDNDGGRKFDVLVLDAFSGDSIPTHLLTYQAMGVYLEHVVDDGVIAFHVTNQHFELTPVLADLSEKYQLTAVYAQSQRDETTQTAESAWVLLSRQPQVFAKGPLRKLPLINRETLRNDPVTWTDDYCSLFSVMRPLFQFDPNKQLREAAAFARAGKLEDAEEVLRDVVADDPRNHSAWFQLGQLMDFQQRRRDAAVALAKAVELKPTADGYHLLGIQLHEANRQRAMQCYQEAIRLDPNHTQSLVNLGVLLAQQNQLVQAKQLFLRAVKLQPGHQQAAANLKRIEQLQNPQLLDR